MLHKKAMIFTLARDTISFVIGLILAAFGIVPFLATIGVLASNPLGSITNLPTSILIWVVAFGGCYILIDGFIEPPMHMLHWFLILAGLILAAIGLIPLLHSFGVIGFTIPVLGTKLIVYHIIIGLEGILLMIGGLTEH
jgi:hypothetical protein